MSKDTLYEKQFEVPKRYIYPKRYLKSVIAQLIGNRKRKRGKTMKDEIIKLINRLDSKKDSKVLEIIYYFIKSLIKLY